MNTQLNTYIQNEVEIQDISSLFPRYIAYLDASPKTVSTYMRALRQFAKYIRDNGITRPERQDIIDYRETLAARLKANTVQNYIVVVRLFFQWTAMEGIYPNIADHVKGAKVSKEYKKDYLSAKQVRRVLPDFDRDSVTGRRDYALFILMVVCGLRDIEAHRANIEDLRPLGEDQVLYIQGKGKQDRAQFVKVPEPVDNALRDMLADRKAAAGSEPLFVSYSNNSRGKRMSTRSISGTIKSALVAAGYNSDRLTAHSLRHTAVTLSLLGGNTLEEVQQYARHTNISTTQIYAHHLDRVKNRCESTVADAILGEGVPVE